MGVYACLYTFTYIILSMKKRTLKQQKYTNNYALINYIYIYSNVSIFIFQEFQLQRFQYSSEHENYCCKCMKNELLICL